MRLISSKLTEICGKVVHTILLRKLQKAQSTTLTLSEEHADLQNHIRIMTIQHDVEMGDAVELLDTLEKRLSESIRGSGKGENPRAEFDAEQMSNATIPNQLREARTIAGALKKQLDAARKRHQQCLTKRKQAQITIATLREEVDAERINHMATQSQLGAARQQLEELQAVLEGRLSSSPTSSTASKASVESEEAVSSPDNETIAALEAKIVELEDTIGKLSEELEIERDTAKNLVANDKSPEVTDSAVIADLVKSHNDEQERLKLRFFTMFSVRGALLANRRQKITDSELLFDEIGQLKVDLSVSQEKNETDTRAITKLWGNLNKREFRIKQLEDKIAGQTANDADSMAKLQEDLRAARKEKKAAEERADSCEKARKAQADAMKMQHEMSQASLRAAEEARNGSSEMLDEARDRLELVIGQRDKARKARTKLEKQYDEAKNSLELVIRERDDAENACVMLEKQYDEAVSRRKDLMTQHDSQVKTYRQLSRAADGNTVMVKKFADLSKKLKKDLEQAVKERDDARKRLNPETQLILFDSKKSDVSETGCAQAAPKTRDNKIAVCDRCRRYDLVCSRDVECAQCKAAKVECTFEDSNVGEQQLCIEGELEVGPLKKTGWGLLRNKEPRDRRAEKKRKKEKKHESKPK